MTDEFQDHFHVLIDGYGEDGKEEGDVITQDGEVIGTWSIDLNDFLYFTPNGQAEHIIGGPFFGIVCKEIREWHEEQERKAGYLRSD